DLRRWAETHQRPRLAPQVPAAIGRQVEGDPAHPRLGHVIVPQPRPADRGGGKRLLDNLFGLVEVAGDRQELAQQPPDRAGVERLEAFRAGHRAPRWRTPSSTYTPCGGAGDGSAIECRLAAPAAAPMQRQPVPRGAGPWWRCAPGVGPAGGPGVLGAAADLALAPALGDPAAGGGPGRPVVDLAHH